MLPNACNMPSLKTAMGAAACNKPYIPERDLHSYQDVLQELKEGSYRYCVSGSYLMNFHVVFPRKNYFHKSKYGLHNT